MKKYALLLVTIWMTTFVFGAIRTADEAAGIAAEFLNTSAPAKNVRRAPAAKKTMRLVHTTLKNQSADAAFYVFNQSEKGFIIISADDRTEDILCYSDEGTFNPETINPNFAWWLSRYQEQISAVTNEMAYTPAEKAAARKATQTTAISPLLGKIAWDQGTPYNNLCPTDPTDKTKSYTGCVATAAAQVLRFWKFPAQGVGTKTYTCTYENKKTEDLTANFGATTYDWDNMLETYGSSYTTAQGTAVATLMYHCGVAAEMSYGGEEAGGSGAWTDVLAAGLADHFNYQYTYFITEYSKKEYGTAAVPADKALYDVTKSSFTTYFNADLEAGRPIVMGGESSSSGGHEFVCDGRDANGKFHINWGWSGESDCYCELSSLKPSGTSYKFSTNIDAIIGLQPALIDTVHVTGITVSPANKTLKINEKATLSATIAPSNATIKMVTWSSSDKSVVTVTDGAIVGIKAGSAFVIATTKDGGFKDTCTVTVTSDTIETTECEDYSYTFTKKCTSGEQTLGDVDWTVTIEDAAFIGFDNSKGVQYGSGNNPAKSVTFITEATEECTLSEITVNASIGSKGNAVLKVYIGETQVGSAITLTSTATDYSFTNSNNLQGAVKIALSNTSRAMYVKSIAWTGGGSSSDTVHVSGVTLSPSTATIAVKATTQLTATIAPSNATVKSVIWTSSDSTVATVTNGLVTGVKAGSATITVTTQDGNFTAHCAVTVQEGSTPTSQSITIAQFLSKKDTKTAYQLTGIVEKIEKTDYGNFTLTDSTGSIYIYGLINGSVTKDVMTTLNITEKDTLTLSGVYNEYKSKPQIKNASYIAHSKYTGKVVDISNTPETAYTVTKAKSLINDGEGLSTKVYVKGTVSEIKSISTKDGNATFTISDGIEEMLIYRIKGFNDQSITDENIITKGCDVIVYGVLSLYQSTTYELMNGYFHSIDCTTTDVQEAKAEQKVKKVIENGQMIMVKDGVRYSILGQKLQ